MDGLGSSWAPDGTQPITGGDALRAPDVVPVRDDASTDAAGGDELGSRSPTAADAIFRTGKTSSSADAAGEDGLGSRSPAAADAISRTGTGSSADLLGEPWFDAGLDTTGGDGTGGGGWADAAMPGAFVLPPMPALGEASEHADALSRWMDDDRARSDDAPPAPPVPSPRTPRTSAHTGEGPSSRLPVPTEAGRSRTSPVPAGEGSPSRVPARTDDVPVAAWRVVDRTPPRREPLRGEPARTEIGTPVPADDEVDEDAPDPLRGLREERDFERQFGAWREGAVRPTTPTPASKIPVLLLAVLVVIIAWFALVGGMR